MDPGAWGYAPAGATSEAAAVVVSARDAKRLKEKLDAAGWLDRTRRPVTHPADDETGRPAAVAFPVLAGSLEGVREMARGDAGALAVCDAALPNLATPVDQRAAPRASGGGANDTAGADRGVLPPPPPLDPDAPPLWPPPVPEAPARRDVARVRCPATAEAFAELARAAGGEPLVLTDVPMGNATTAWTPERFATCAEAGHLVDVHVCPPDADESGQRNSTGGPRAAPVVDLAGHRAPGTRRNFQFRAMPLAEFAARVVASGTKGGQTHRTSYPPVVAEGETYYLRSVADAKKKRTHVSSSFPSLASDLSPGALLPPLSFLHPEGGRDC
jgi:tRNA wybutosine-synthesizing protein 5